jgi:hypothetical protein
MCIRYFYPDTLTLTHIISTKPPPVHQLARVLHGYTPTQYPDTPTQYPETPP